MSDGTRLPVYGADLFSGSFASARPGPRPDYVIQAGDQVAVRVFGAVNSDSVQTVDPAGQLFLQGIGPISVSGVAAGQLQARVAAALRSVYTDAVGVYVNIISGGTLGVFITGDIQRPGRYVGSPNDSILYFLDQGGGIDPARGSFRNIVVRRGGQVVGRYDLYDFLLRGNIEPFRFQDGDIIFVPARGPLVAATGAVRNAYAFETPAGSPTISGQELLDLAIPSIAATGVSAVQIKDGMRNAAYYNLPQLAAAALIDGTTVSFRSEVYTETISVSLRGDIKGQTAFVLPRGATLGQLLAQVPLEGTDVVRDYIHIERVSVALSQKKALDQALDNLQKAAITQPALTSESAQVRAQTISQIQAYVDQARGAQPDGKVAVYTDGIFHDLQLVSGDVVVLPARSDVVLIGGEVLSPGAFSHADNLTARDYVNRAGGFGENANKKRLVLRRADGTALVARPDVRPRAGDQIVVVPSFGNRTIQLLRDLTQIAFQVATTAAVVINVSK